MSEPLFHALFDQAERRPLTVSELTEAVRRALEARFSSVWVEGEISNFNAHSSGHWYFTIRDEGAQLRAKCFRSANTRIRFRPTDGLHVRARGRVSVYALRGEYELIVEALDPVGAGALRVAFEQLRDRLRAEGLFAQELKRALPVFPRRVGVVTSPTGAAIRDILNVISRRTRTVHVLFSPARVQGEGAGRDIARAIKLLNEHHDRALRENRKDDLVNVLIVGRGGGSSEDLWAFNEEEVARAIRASAIPVISAVGHETDFTIADFVADRRAPTPSAAAELVTAHEEQLCSQLESLIGNLARSIRFRISAERSRVQQLAYSRGFDEVRGQLRTAMTATDDAEYRLQTSIAARLQSALRRLDAAAHALTPSHLRERVATGRARFDALCHARDAALTARMERAGQQFSLATAGLDAMSPLRVLERGYAIAQDATGGIVRKAKTVSAGDELRLRLWKGTLDCRVEAVD